MPDSPSHNAEGVLKEVEDKFRRRGQRKAKRDDDADLPFGTENHLAKTFVDKHGNELRYTDALKRWNHWDGAQWRKDNTLANLDLARRHCATVAEKATGWKAISFLNSTQASFATLKFAASDRRIAMRPEDWDHDPMLLATPGGTVDLRTGKLRAADPGDYITRCTSVTPGGECPLWLKTLDAIFQGDAERIAFIQRWFGYCLTGLIREEIFLLQNGGGGNGKGTINGTMSWIMGDYATGLTSSVLMQTIHPQHTTDVAKLRGARMALAPETPENARWNVERLKAITGGDLITARGMRENSIDFTPTHKVVVSGNQLPKLGNVDVALKRRAVLLQFNKTFSGTQSENKKLKEALKSEGSGILQWTIEGCLDWQRNGLMIPASIQSDTDDYLRNMDDLKLWLDECCILETDPTGRLCTTKELLGSYVKWRERNAGAWISATDFPDRLRALGIVVDSKRSNSNRYVRDIRLVSAAEERDQREWEERHGEQGDLGVNPLQ